MTLVKPVRNDSGNADRMPVGHSIRILVLPRGDIRPLFYFEPTIDEETDEPDSAGSKSDGSRKWLRTALERVRHIEQHVPERFRHPLTWLKSRLPADERLLMALRSAEVVELVHPTRMTHEEVSTAWSSYLDSRLRKRIFWFVFYAMVIVPSIMLAMLPGPNVLGFWVTYRLVAHGLAIFSVYRALKHQGRVEQVSNAVLDGPILTQRNEANRIQDHFQMLGLAGRLKRERIVARLRKRKESVARAKAIVEQMR